MKKLILTMCLTAAGVFGAAAQMRLTLGEALDLALSENPTVKVAEMEVQHPESTGWRSAPLTGTLLTPYYGTHWISI